MSYVISNDEIKPYSLPPASKLGDNKDSDFSKNFFSLQNLNRQLVFHDIEKIKEHLELSTKDRDLGERYILSATNHETKLEIKRFCLGHNFLKKCYITPDGREIMVNWLFSFQVIMGFNNEVLHTSVAIINRYLKVSSFLFKVIISW